MKAAELLGALLCGTLGALQIACAGAPPKEIADAHAAMERARQSPAAARARLDLFDAEATLAGAERELRAGSRMSRAHAYLAMRMAERARIAGLFAADQEAYERAREKARWLREILERRRASTYMYPY